MISNRLFSKSMRLDYRREFPWTAAYALLMFFLLPVAYLFGLQSLRAGWQWQNAATMAGRETLLYNYAVSHLGIGVMGAAMFIFGALEAYHEFGYLHRKTELDFYHALPQTRRQIFFGRFVNGLKTVLLPYLLCEGIACICAVFSGLSPAPLISLVITAVLLNMLIFLLSYALAILAVMLTGRALTGLLGMAVLNGFCPAIASLAEEIPSLWFRTYFRNGPQSLPIRILTELSPVVQLVNYADVYEQRFLRPVNYEAVTTGFIFRILLGFAVLCAIVLLSIALYERRPLEKTGDAMAFSKTERPIRILLTIFAMLAAMDFMRSLDRSLGWIIFFTLAAVILGHILVELIYRGDPRKLFGHKIELAVMAVCATAFILLVAFDVFGFERYLPEEEQVVSVKMEMDDRQELMSVFNVESRPGIYDMNLNYSISYYGALKDYTEPGSGEEPGSLTDAADIHAVREIAAAGIEEAQKRRSSYGSSVNLLNGTSPAEDTEETRQVLITWTLKGGRIRQRQYQVPAHAMRDEYSVLFDSPEYRQYEWPLLRLDEKRDLSVAEYCELTEAFSFDEADSKKIIDAYLMDIRAMTMEELGASYPTGILRIYLTPEFLRKIQIDPYAVLAETGQSGTGTDQVCFLMYPVYPQFEYTVKALEAAGVPFGAAASDLPDGFAYSLYVPGDGENRERYYEGTVSDLKDCEIVRRNLVIYPYSVYNPYAERLDPDLNISFRLGNTEYSGNLIDNEETRALIESIKKSAS